MALLFLLSGGLCYAVIFWALAWWRPQIALFLILASAPFQNDISGGGPVKFSLAEINLLLSLPIVILRGRRFRFGPSLVPALAYLAVGLLCSFPHWRPSTLTCLVQVSIYLIIVVAVFASLAKEEEDYRAALNGLLLVCCFLALVVMVQRTAYVFGLHKNGIGASIATAFVIAFELWLAETRPSWRRVYMVAAAILAGGCLLALSRGAWLAALTGAFIIFALRRQFGLMLRTVVMLAPIVALCWWTLPAQDREYATGFEGERENIKLRYESIDFALEKFHDSPVIGMGVGLRKEYDATNFFLLTLAETGILGVLTMALLYGVIGHFLWRLHRRVPRRGLPFSLVAIAAALIFGKLAHGMVDHYWSRGSLTVAWASLGMAVLVADVVRRRRLEARRARLTAELAARAPEADLTLNASVVSGTLSETQIPCG